MSVLPLTINRTHFTSSDLPLADLAQYESLGADMVEAMLASVSIGLAAAQIGKT